MDKDIESGKTAPEQKLLIGGHWLEGREWYEVRDKISGEVLAVVPMCDDELLEMAVLAARDSGAALAALSPERRAAGLRSWADNVVRDAARLANTLHRETAVPQSWARQEVQQAATALRRAAAEAEQINAETVTVPSGAGTLASLDFSLRHPVGTVAVILPDRHPLFYAAQLSGAALAAGCPAILKPAPLAPLTVTQFVELGCDRGWSAGSLNLVFGSNRDLGERLAADQRVVLVAVAGRLPEREALSAARAGRPMLTVGTGFGCALLDRNVDLPQTTTRLLSLRFRAPLIGRPAPVFILAPQALTSGLNESLTSGLASLKGADLSDPAAEVPRQISDGLAQRVAEWLTSMQQVGGILVHGGQRRGSYVEPTVLTAPAGYREFPPPPADAPVFVIDAYDKQPQRHLARIPNLEETTVFTGDIQSALALVRLPDVPRVDVYTTRPGRVSTADAGYDGEALRRVMAGMTRRKWVEMHLGG